MTRADETMSRVAFAKWMDELDEQTRVSDAARATLSSRLRAIAHYLPLAAEHSTDDIEHVHQLRVWTRRATSVLRLYREYLPRKRARRMRRTLRDLRGAAGDARDLDVLAARKTREAEAEVERVLEVVAQHRSVAQERIVEVARSLSDAGGLDRATKKLLARVRARGARARDEDDARFESFARERVEHASVAFFASEPEHRRDFEALHRFRIRGKEFRYAMEALASALPPVFRAELVPALEVLQDHLGTINDHAVARTRLREWAADAADALVRGPLMAHAAAEELRVERAIDDLGAWWTDERRVDFRTKVERALSKFGG